MVVEFFQRVEVKTAPVPEVVRATEVGVEVISPSVLEGETGSVFRLVGWQPPRQEVTVETIVYSVVKVFVPCTQVLVVGQTVV